MRCSVCKQNLATQHFTAVAGGVTKYEKHVCVTCAPAVQQEYEKMVVGPARDEYLAATIAKPIRFVYVAGPLSKPSELDNIRAAVVWGDRVLDAGFVPLIPHLDALWHLISSRPYETWLAWCLAWVERCDAVLRIPGASAGADREVAHARDVGIPVFYAGDHLEGDGLDQLVRITKLVRERTGGQTG